MLADRLAIQRIADIHISGRTLPAFVGTLNTCGATLEPHRSCAATLMRAPARAQESAALILRDDSATSNKAVPKPGHAAKKVLS